MNDQTKALPGSGVARASEVSLCLGGHFALPDAPEGLRTMREIVGGGHGCDLLAVAGKGLIPVPTVDVLVTGALTAFDKTDSSVGEGEQKCCGCGGCDKNKS